MENIETFYEEKLLAYGFEKAPVSDAYNSAGRYYRISSGLGCGNYWVYAREDLYNIKIHDFYFHKDHYFDIATLSWPECLGITYYKSVSGEELMPYRRLSAGCVKTFIGDNTPFKAVLHKNIPLQSIGIEIMPAYYDRYLKELYGSDYLPPHEAFVGIDQTDHFPEMISLLQQLWNYRGEGLAARLYYDGKVSEALALIIAYNKERSEQDGFALTGEDRLLLENTAAYLNDHFNRDTALEHLARIACMGTTKLKASFKKMYGCTITEYITQRRLSQAENLLATTDFTIEQIARAIGYSNAGRFAAVFRKTTGMYPADYRKMAQRS